MKFLYFIIYVVISVIASEDDSYFNDTAGQPVHLQLARYFVAIKQGDAYICNGVILAPFFALAPSNCIVFQDLSAYIVVHNKIRFTTTVRSNCMKSIVNISRLEDKHDGKDVSFRMVVLKVNSSFPNRIRLPLRNAVVPNQGTILFRTNCKGRSDEYLLVEKIFPTEPTKLNTTNSVLLRTGVTEEQTFKLNGAPYLIDGTLYGMIVVQIDYPNTGTEYDFILLLNIAKVVNKLRSVLTKE